jgi:hypothetical protein
MNERLVSVDGAPRLTLVELAGNARVSGWDRHEVLVRVEGDVDGALTVERTAEGLSLSISEACELRVPAGLPLHVRQAQGNLAVDEVISLNAEQVRGNLRLVGVAHAHLAEVYGNLRAEDGADLRVVGTVYGNASLKEVQTADLQNVRGDLLAKELQHLRASRVGGNLQAKEVAGAVVADRVGGNATLKEVGGPLTIDQVAGNLAVRDLAGGAGVPRVGGNLILNGGLGRGQTYHFQADGNALLRLAGEAGAHVTLGARGKILSSLPLAGEERSEGRLSGTLGEGGAEIVVEAGGNIVLGGEGGGVQIHVEVGDEIARQVEESLRAVDLEAIGRQMSQEMESAMSRLRVKLESTDWQRYGSQAQQAVERAMERLQRNLDRAADKAARYQERMERAHERAERATGHQERHRERQAEPVPVEDWQEGEPDGPPSATPAPSVDEERLSILRMVEQGQITPAEAELLLDALD